MAIHPYLFYAAATPTRSVISKAAAPSRSALALVYDEDYIALGACPNALKLASCPKPRSSTNPVTQVRP